MSSFLILLGYMGCGKSELGKKISISRSIPFIDLDHFIEEKEKCSISSIFKDHGELYFRKKERFYLEMLFEFDNDMVISLGGGTPCYFDNIDFINSFENKTTVYLKTTPKELTRRLFKQMSHRPIISHLKTSEALLEFISKHLFERTFYYLKADKQLITDGKTTGRLVEEFNNLA
jgi:shikimate kinase